jgi:hypothetical protein
MMALRATAEGGALHASSTIALNGEKNRHHAKRWLNVEASIELPHNPINPGAALGSRLPDLHRLPAQPSAAN